MAGHADMQRLQPLQQLKTVEGGKARAEIAQESNAHLQNVSKIAEGRMINQTMVTRIRRGEFREAPARPVKTPGIDHRTADAGAMPTDEFSQGVADDIRPMFDRAKERRGGDGIIDNQWQAGSMGNLRQGFKVIDIILGVTDGLSINRFGMLVDRGGHRTEIGSGHEFHRNPHPAEGMMEKVIGATIKGRRSNDIVTAAANIKNSQSNRRRTGCEGQRSDPAIQSGKALLKNVGGRIHQPRIDIPHLLESKEIGGVLRRMKDIRGGLIDRYGPRTGRRIGFLSGVQGQSSELLFCRVSHIAIPFD